MAQNAAQLRLITFWTVGAAIATPWNASLQPDDGRPLVQTALYFLTMVLILVFAAWGKPAEPTAFWDAVYRVKWPMAIALLAVLAVMLWRWFTKEELGEWVDPVWNGLRRSPDLRELESLETMRIEILGPGCAKCEKTTREVERVVRKLGVDATVKHVTEMSEIVDRGVMLTPAVFIDEKKKIEGKVPKASHNES